MRRDRELVGLVAVGARAHAEIVDMLRPCVTGRVGVSAPVERLTGTTLGGLLDLAEADRKTLLDTVDALLSCGGSPTHTARTLFCHRTVIYRMRRIESVTGRSLADPRDRLLLTLGVMALHARRGA